MNLSQPKNYYSYAAALFAVFIWGMFPVMIKGALQFISVDQLLMFRFFVSLLLFITIIPRTFRKIRYIPLSTSVIFVCTIIFLFYSQTYALDEVPASWYIGIFTFVPILFLLVYREPLNFMGYMGSALATGGMIMFFWSMRQESGMTFGGVALLFMSILAWVAYSVIAKKLHHHLQDRELVALTSVIGFISSLGVWSAHGLHIQNISLPGLGLCILAGIVLPLALVAYSFSLRFKPVFAVFSQYLEPIIGLVIAALFLGERMNFSQYVAASIVLSGTLLVGIATRKG